MLVWNLQTPCLQWIWASPAYVVSLDRVFIILSLRDITWVVWAEQWFLWEDNEWERTSHFGKMPSLSFSLSVRFGWLPWHLCPIQHSVLRIFPKLLLPSQQFILTLNCSRPPPPTRYVWHPMVWPSHITLLLGGLPHVTLWLWTTWSK